MKAIPLKGGANVFYCNTCEEWNRQELLTTDELYWHDSSEVVLVNNGDHGYYFSEGCGRADAYYCGECDAWNDGDPEIETQHWECGKCKTRYVEKEDADACCS